MSSQVEELLCRLPVTDGWTRVLQRGACNVGGYLVESTKGFVLHGRLSG